jgi:hypothetical protein
MPETGVLIQNSGGATQEIGATDILVAIPTYNNADTIGSLLDAARNGLVQFSAYKTAILQADGGSDDGTVQRAKDALDGWQNLIQVSYPLYPVHKLAVTAQSVPGRESAFHTIFSAAERLEVKACCIVEPGTNTVTADWIGSLIQPVLDSRFDYVVPQYLRQKYEGTLINGIMYPMVRALYGKQIRQPIGNDFGLSGGFIRHCLTDSNWSRDIQRHAVDLCTTISAIGSGFKICQALLGPRPPVRREQSPDLRTVLMETAGALFGQVELTAEQWQRVRGSEPVSTFGLRFDAEYEDPAIDVKSMIEQFRLGFVNLQDIWGLILPPATLLELKKMNRQSDQDFRFPDEFWVRTVYDFAVAHRLRTLGRDHVMGAFTPVYLAWVASFILNIREARPREVSARIENLCKTYEAQKPYLISRWRWPDRFMP